MDFQLKTLSINKLVSIALIYVRSLSLDYILLITAITLVPLITLLNVFCIIVDFEFYDLKL